MKLLSPTAELARLVARSSSAALGAVSEELISGRMTLNTSSVLLQRLHGVDYETAVAVGEAFRALQGVIDPIAVGFALAVGRTARDAERDKSAEIEIAWSGPGAEGSLVRPTRSVIEEMVRGAHQEILIVGYTMTVGPQSAMAGVIRLLEDATRRGVDVKLVLHHGEGHDNRVAVLNAWDARTRKPTMLTWDPPPDNPYTKLHAKVLIVDRLQALVGSANFTFLGLESNLELGLRVKGREAEAIARRFDRLEESGVLRSWD